jgi:hypothetical protein
MEEAPRSSPSQTKQTTYQATMTPLAMPSISCGRQQAGRALNGCAFCGCIRQRRYKHIFARTHAMLAAERRLVDLYPSQVPEAIRCR